MTVELQQRLRASEVADLDPYNQREKPVVKVGKELIKEEVVTIQKKTETKTIRKESSAVQSIKEQQKELAQSIRKHVKDQKKLWNFIPDLCLEAQGRGGYGDNWAYQNKLYPISEGGNYEFIDLRKATIVGYDFSKKKTFPIGDDSVIELSSNLYKFDAVSKVERFLKEIQQLATGSIGKTPEEVEEWREGQRQIYGLNKPDINHVKQILQEYKESHGIK